MLTKTTVGVTGMGIISSIGNDVEEFCSALKEGKSGIRHVENKKEPKITVDIAAEIQNFSFKHSIEKFQNVPEETLNRALKLGQRAPFVIQTSIISAIQAWQNAGLLNNAPSPERIGIVVAGQNTTQNYQYDLIPKFKKDPEYLSPRYALQYLETNQVGVLSELFGIRGEGLVVGGASATGNVGIIKGAQIIAMGLADVCLVVGIVADLSPMDIKGFINIGAMGGKNFLNQSSKACRPFDSRHEGFIYGQAGGCIVIESPKSARQREVPLQAEIRGSSINLDSNSSADPNLNGEKNAMLFALERSSLLSSDVDYINAHGSSSSLGDIIEAEAIYQTFGKHALDLWVNATKGLTGHCLYSAGIVEAIATIVQMKEGFIHANKNLEDPIRDDVKFCGLKTIDYPINVALSNSFGFGGINTSIVFVRE